MVNYNGSYSIRLVTVRKLRLISSRLGSMVIFVNIRHNYAFQENRKSVLLITSVCLNFRHYTNICCIVFFKFHLGETYVKK